MALPFEPSVLLDMSPTHAIYVAAEHAPDLDPGREAETYDQPRPDDGFSFAPGRPLGRLLDPAHNATVWSKP